MKKRYETPEAHRLRSRLWRDANLERARELDRQRNQTEHRKAQQYRNNLERKYGIKFEEYAYKLRIQDGRCAICGKSNEQFDGKRRRNLHLDHAHGSGKIRGLLCTHCNFGIGHFFEDPVLLRKAIEYLEAWAAEASA